MKKKLIVILLALFCLTHKVFAGDFALNDREKEFLVNLSRQTLYWYLKDGTVPAVNEQDLTENLKLKKACFVSLYKKDIGLRGCVGLFEAKEPLYKNVIDRTIAAAVKDERFDPVQYRELQNIKLDISVLTDPILLPFNSPQDLLDKLQPGRDGVIIATKYGSSTYLPQVWDQLPDKREFLSNLCVKQGAPINYWETNWKNINVKIYHAIVFGEEVYGRIVIGKNGAVVGEKGAYLMGAVKPLKEGLYYGAHKASKGTKLMPGAIVSSDSDIIE